MIKMIPFTSLRLISEREISALGDEYIRDRRDVYRHVGINRDYYSCQFVFEYELFQINCNPDFDW